MFMKDTKSDSLIKLVDPAPLFDPVKSSVQGRQQEGQEEQPPMEFDKSQLVFPSGESLPRCWTDPDYML
ncbi:acetyltransferase [Pseudanabaena sp. FACHB-2040]|uniref:acetyltransferase n=1 Tax=Pseudanabaena sp. FACHB-2040 TaxID=2692859 RepID=UPI0016851664|nr:acetyltransferase [Pseudanabaena sp. FACHB-2040]MBD2256019.1 acetyltransferase [Pseudanabaena sp. FACHB-2040]